MQAYPLDFWQGIRYEAKCRHLLAGVSLQTAAVNVAIVKMIDGIIKRWNINFLDIVEMAF